MRSPSRIFAMRECVGNEWKDLIYSARYLERFSRRNGEWKIDFRFKIIDWMRIMEGSDPSFDNVPAQSRRDRDDMSYKIFGDKVFARPS